MAFNVDANNRQLHWGTFLQKRQACQGSDSRECQTINRIGGESHRFVDFLALPEANVLANFDAAGKVVSYTLLDKGSNQPLMIMEPAEFAAYREAPASTRGWYQLAPQWSLDTGSAVSYAGMGDADKAREHLGYAVSSPEYWVGVGTGVLGGVVLRGGTGTASTRTRFRGAPISNDILKQPRVGYGAKGEGSGNKVDQIPSQQVVGMDGRPVPIYPERPNGPFASQESPPVAVAHGFPSVVDHYANGAVKFPLGNGATL